MEIMSWVYIVMAAFGSIAIFLVILPFTRKENTTSDKNSRDKKNGIEENRKPKINENICPVCEASLSNNDTIYIKRYPAQPEDKIFIKGCNHCYNPEMKQRK